MTLSELAEYGYHYRLDYGGCCHCHGNIFQAAAAVTTRCSALTTNHLYFCFGVTSSSLLLRQFNGLESVPSKASPLQFGTENNDQIKEWDYGSGPAEMG
jgi:hypothetical protein